MLTAIYTTFLALLILSALATSFGIFAGSRPDPRWVVQVGLRDETPTVQQIQNALNLDCEVYEYGEAFEAEREAWLDSFDHYDTI